MPASRSVGRWVRWCGWSALRRNGARTPRQVSGRDGDPPERVVDEVHAGCPVAACVATAEGAEMAPGARARGIGLEPAATGLARDDRSLAIANRELGSKIFGLLEHELPSGESRTLEGKCGAPQAPVAMAARGRMGCVAVAEAAAGGSTAARGC